MRKLVTVRKVVDVFPIKGADFIEAVSIGGWTCVSSKGTFEVGDYGVYFEIDSALPAEDERYSMLEKGGSKNFNGFKVYRIKTMKLRNQVSQGLLLPLKDFPEVEEAMKEHSMTIEELCHERVDLSERLNVMKYEPPVKSPDAIGVFPNWIQKTDQERINNVFDYFSEKYKDRTFVATYKMDGSSSTYSYTTNEQYQVDKGDFDEEGGQFLVCSRNLATKNDDSNPWYVASQKYQLEDKLKQFHKLTGRNIAVQAERLGPGVQGNREKFRDYTLRFFSVWDIDEHRYLNFTEMSKVFTELDLPMVEVVDTFKPFEAFSSVEEFIKYADDLQPIHADIPEGVVYHTLDGEHVSFKTISTEYLLNGGH